MFPLNYFDNVRNIINQRRKLTRAMDAWDKPFADFCIQNSIEPISDEEFAPICSFWKRYTPIPLKRDFYSIIKASEQYKNSQHHIVDFHYIPDSVVFSYLTPKLNPISVAKLYANKGLYGVIFENVNRPYEFIRVCNGVVLDNSNHIRSIGDLVNQVADYGLPIVAKKSVDTSGGKSVKILNKYSIDDVRSLVNEYQNDFVVQKLVEQSDKTARMNEASLNTFRITTLLLNGKVSVLSGDFRCGAKGSFLDNTHSGGGVYWSSS